jgi:hypothetical protein
VNTVMNLRVMAPRNWILNYCAFPTPQPKKKKIHGLSLRAYGQSLNPNAM